MLDDKGLKEYKFGPEEGDHISIGNEGYLEVTDNQSRGFMSSIITAKTEDLDLIKYLLKNAGELKEKIRSITIEFDYEV